METTDNTEAVLMLYTSSVAHNVTFKNSLKISLQIELYETAPFPNGTICGKQPQLNSVLLEQIKNCGLEPIGSSKKVYLQNKNTFS